MPLSFKTKMFKQFSIVSVLILNSLALPAVAKDYKVELLVFENQTQSQAFEANNYDRPASMVSRAETWKIPPTMLLGVRLWPFIIRESKLNPIASLQFLGYWAPY